MAREDKAHEAGKHVAKITDTRILLSEGEDALTDRAHDRISATSQKSKVLQSELY